MFNNNDDLVYIVEICSFKNKHGSLMECLFALNKYVFFLTKLPNG